MNPHNGNLVIHDTEALVKCADKTYPPTPSTCPSFVKTGVTDHRTITQNHAGLVTWVTDVFTSTDGKKHSLDLLWANNQRFHSSNGDSTQVAYKFPGQSSFSTHAVKDTVSLPKSAPAKILVNVKGAADGDTATGQGAIVYDRPATTAKFNTVAGFERRVSPCIRRARCPPEARRGSVSRTPTASWPPGSPSSPPRRCTPSPAVSSRR